METNLHLVIDEQTISEDDLYLFEVCLENNISSIMVSHQIAKGELDSGKKHSTVSEEVISNIDDSILVIADEINMQGLKAFYPDKTKLYIDLINSGENLILDFDLDSVELYELIQEIELQVEKGNIDEDKINELWVGFLWIPKVKDTHAKSFLIDSLEEGVNDLLEAGD